TVVSFDVGAKQRDASRPRDPSEMVEQQGPDASALLGVGDLERNLGSAGLLELHVAPDAEEGLDIAASHHRREHDVRAAVSDQKGQLRITELALGTEEPVPDRARTHA